MSSNGATKTLCVVDGVSKRYRLGALTAGDLRWAIPSVSTMVRRASALVRWQQGSPVEDMGRPADLWALRDVSFQLGQGETIGILGRNGAGKSTLLKLIAGITEPTRGRVTVNGRISALIELIAGFHPDLTGRENIYLNASILGMRRQEIRSKFDSIVAFSEIEPFLDTPVKRYSSGMQARLGFAVAAHVKPDLLLVDEVLAVGDLSFQQKCLDHMQELGRQGVTVVLISHSMEKITSFCRRGLLLVRGELRADGPIQEVARQYFDYLQQAGQDDPGAIIRSIDLTDDRGRPLADIPVGGSVTLHIRLALPRPVAPTLELQVIRTDGLVCAQSFLSAGAADARCAPGEYELAVEIRELPLLPGLYNLEVAVHDGARGNELLERRPSAATLMVSGSLSAKGVVELRASLRAAAGPVVSPLRIGEGSPATTWTTLDAGQRRPTVEQR